MGSPIRVLNVIAEDRLGGPQLRILRVARALRAQGVETIVAIPKGNGGFGRLLSESDIPFYELGNLMRLRATPNPVSQMAWFMNLLGSIRSLIGIMKKENIAIVHQSDVTHVQGAIAGRLAKRKVVWHINGMPYPIIWKSFKPLLYSVPHVVVASSRAMGRDYFGADGGLLARPFEVLYPPVDCHDYQESRDSGSFRREFQIPESCPLIGMVGNLYPTKGHVYFLRAAKIIVQHYPDARFLIVGQRFDTRKKYSIKLEKEVRRLGLSEAVTFTEFRSDIANVMNAMDILVHPSLSESFGMAAAEALAAGKPVVAAAVGGVPEIVLHNETGILVPPRDPAAIADGVVSLLKQPQFACSLAARGRERVNRLFSTERCAQEHARIYRRVFAETG